MDNDNHNHNHNRNIDEPPPQKKHKTSTIVRKRRFDHFPSFSSIITRLGREHNECLFTCFKYTNKKGVTCEYCCADNKLAGPFTEQQPIKEFNYSKLKGHIWTAKHYKRIKDNEIKQFHPLFASTSQNNTKQKEIEQIAIHMLSALDRIINAIKLVHLVIKEGCPFNKVKPLNQFYSNNFIERQLSSIWHVDQIILAMNNHQKHVDHMDVFGVDNKEDFAMCLDGSSASLRSVKIFDVKGWKVGVGPVTKYAVCLDSKKSMVDFSLYCNVITQ
jgi:hypothetical protein